MKDELFDELAASVREGADILSGKQEPSRRFQLEALDIHSIRKQFELSQSQFAALLGVSVKTLQNWEQGRRQPNGAAQVLLQVAARYPETVWEVAQSMVTEH